MIKPTPCPKSDRCIHAAECVPGTFRGEFLCFESSGYSDYEKNVTLRKPKPTKNKKRR